MLQVDLGHTKVDGRRLVAGGDTDWEIAAEIRTIDGEEMLFVRIWLQAIQLFTVYAIDEHLVMRDHGTAKTYRKASDEIIAHLTA